MARRPKLFSVSRIRILASTEPVGVSRIRDRCLRLTRSAAQGECAASHGGRTSFRLRYPTSALALRRAPRRTALRVAEIPMAPRRRSSIPAGLERGVVAYVDVVNEYLVAPPAITRSCRGLRIASSVA